MKDFSDFEFKQVTLFRVVVDGNPIANVPLGSLEHFLLCMFHCNAKLNVRVSLSDNDNEVHKD